MKATEKQISYALFLLGKNGYSIKYMDRQYKDFGATMRERSGMVEDWLAGLNRARASAVISQLIKMGG